MPGQRRNPAIQIRVLGSRDMVPRVVTTLREVLVVEYTSPTHAADLPYEVHRFVGASDLRVDGLPAVLAEINATLKSWSRGNLEPGEALERIQRHTERASRPPEECEAPGGRLSE